MSYVSTYYDAMVTRLTTIMATADGWTRIPNAYEIEQNNDQMLKKGWGLALRSASNTNQELACAMTINRATTVVISREVMKTDHDADGIADVEKSLLEDLRLLVRDFETDTTLQDGTGTGFARYESDDGIELIKEGAFLILRANFTIKFREHLTS